MNFKIHRAFNLELPLRWCCSTVHSVHLFNYHLDNFAGFAISLYVANYFVIALFLVFLSSGLGASIPRFEVIFFYPFQKIVGLQKI